MMEGATGECSGLSNPFTGAHIAFLDGLSVQGSSPMARTNHSILDLDLFHRNRSKPRASCDSFAFMGQALLVPNFL